MCCAAPGRTTKINSNNNDDTNSDTNANHINAIVLYFDYELMLFMNGLIPGPAPGQSGVRLLGRDLSSTSI